MDMTKTVVYEPELGLEGTIPELVDWANKYTTDYSDPALLRISKLAKQYGLDEKYVKIPILLLNEREFENMDCSINAAYERLRIDHYLGDKISLCMSNFRGEEGTELEIREEDDKVLISLYGIDDEGTWTAAGAFPIDMFMAQESGWLDKTISEVRYYTMQRDE